MITPVACAVEARGEGDPKLVGQNKVTVLPGTHLASFLGAGERAEGFFCNYEANAEFLPQFAAAGLRANALGAQGGLRGVELVEHPFFIATLFQPQLTSKRTGRPHPLLIAFAHAASSFHAQARKRARKPAAAE